MSSWASAANVDAALHNNSILRFDWEKYVSDTGKRTIGLQLYVCLLVEDYSPGHQEGIIKFLKIIDNLSEHVKHKNDITEKDTSTIVNIIVTKNWHKLLLKVLNNPLIPGSSSSGLIMRKAMVQAIRMGSLETLETMMNHKVAVLSPHGNAFGTLKSLILNVLHLVSIRGEQSETANLVHPYLVKIFHDLYDSEHDVKMLNDDNLYQEESEPNKMQYSKFFASNQLVRYIIYKKIDVSCGGNHYISKLQHMLKFLCEHDIAFHDEQNMDDLYQECIADKVFDCKGLVKLHKSSKPKYFWSEYLCNKLIDDYLGIGVRKYIDREREQMLQVIEYIVANGVGNRVDEVVMPRLKTAVYIVKNENIQNVLDAIEI